MVQPHAKIARRAPAFAQATVGRLSPFALPAYNPDMTIKPWKLLSQETIFEKHGRKLVKRDYEMPDGKIADFYIKEEKDAACILALTSKNEVILVKQFRPGPNKVLLEMPGGEVDENNPELAVSKELTEETGYRGRIEFVGKCVVEGYTKRTKYCYVAKDCRKTSDQKLEDREFIEVVLMTLNEFRQHLRNGQLTDVEVGYLCLLMYNLSHGHYCF
jgi:ADP-ribose pyrophosphatase